MVSIKLNTNYIYITHLIALETGHLERLWVDLRECDIREVWNRRRKAAGSLIRLRIWVVVFRVVRQVGRRHRGGRDASEVTAEARMVVKRCATGTNQV